MKYRTKVFIKWIYKIKEGVNERYRNIGLHNDRGPEFAICLDRVIVRMHIVIFKCVIFVLLII